MKPTTTPSPSLALPVPWDYIVGKTLIHVETQIDNPAGAGIPICSLPKTGEANAALIVRAVNCHAELIGFILEYQSARATGDYTGLDGAAEALLSKAT